MSFFKKRSVMTVIVVVLVAVLLFVLSLFGKRPGSNVFNTLFTPFQSLVSKVTQPVDTFFSDWRAMKEYKAENETLRRDNAALKRENRSIDEYKIENDRLRRLLGVQEKLELCDTVVAKVIGYAPNNWFDTFTLNKGTNNGIAVSDVVLSADGVVGRITQVGTNWACVSTIINGDHAMGVRISRTGALGVLEGDSRLAKENTCRLDYIVKDASIVVGDVLETSGEGGIYPPGLIVGKVTDLKMDSTGRIQEAVVAPSTDLTRLYEVLVVREWALTEVQPEETPAPTQEPTQESAQNEETEQGEDS